MNSYNRTGYGQFSICTGRCVTEYFHSCSVSDLKPGTKYFYRASVTTIPNFHSYSEVFSFKTKLSGKNTPPGYAPTLAVYGDMGLGSPSLELLKQEAASGQLDAVLHVGDFGYDLDEDGGHTGSQFMVNIEPLAAKVPYMVTPGNHEGGTNFVGALHHYAKRLGRNMPMRENNGMYYSFDIGLAHIVSFSSEVYYWQLW